MSTFKKPVCKTPGKELTHPRAPSVVTLVNASPRYTQDTSFYPLMGILVAVVGYALFEDSLLFCPYLSGLSRERKRASSCFLLLAAVSPGPQQFIVNDLLSP